MIPSGHSSEAERMSEIDSLTVRIKELSDSVDMWNQLMLWALALAGIAAIFIFVATRIIVTRTRQLSAVQDLRNDAKDRQLQIDLKEKDGKIAEAQEGTASLRKQAEDEASARVRLEALIQPRDLTPKQLRDLIALLKPFSGRPISVRSYALDIEGKRLGKTIMNALESAGLQVADNLGGVTNLKGKFIEGIQISGPASQNDLIKSLMNSPLGQEKTLGTFRNLKPGITGQFGDMVFAENPGVFSDVRAEILVGVKPLREL